MLAKPCDELRVHPIIVRSTRERCRARRGRERARAEELARTEEVRLSGGRSVGERERDPLH